MEYEQSFKRLVSLDSQWGMRNQAIGMPGVSGYSTTWSGFVSMLPFLDEGPLYNSIHTGLLAKVDNNLLSYGPYASRGASTQGFNPPTNHSAPNDSTYPPNRTQIGVMRCPSDPGRMNPNNAWNMARTNYGFCLGDGQVGQTSQTLDVDVTRNAFQRGMYHGLQAITDGAATQSCLVKSQLSKPDL